MKYRLAYFSALSILAFMPTVFAETPPTVLQLQQKHVDFAARELKAPEAIKSQLAAMRAKIREQHLQYDVGYTTALELPLDTLAATKIPRQLPPEALKIANLGTELLRIEKERYAEAIKINPNIVKLFPQTCSASSPTWDWRKSNKVTNVKAQICGTCWDFTAIGTYESSYALRNNALVDTSEQYVLNCAHAGSCSGGWWGPVFDFLVTSGTASEADDKFTGDDSQVCPANINTPFRATAWGFVNTTDWTKVPSTQSIKEALCEHGALATAIQATPEFAAYNVGVFSSNETFPWVNHGIVIIGWDDSKGAWLIKNSWGPGWGVTGDYGTDRGYAWVKYGSNNIGIATAWVDALRRFLSLPSSYRELLERAQILHKPLPDPDPATLRRLKLTNPKMD
jgi:cathepsin L